MSDLHKNYLYDLGSLLRERALEAEGAHDGATSGSDEEIFQAGRSLAYYEVMSLLVNQAESFELPIEDLHLEGFEPDRDMLSSRPKNPRSGGTFLSFGDN